MAVDQTVRYCSLLMLSGGFEGKKKKGHWRGGWSMTGRQLDAWSFVWGGLWAEFPLGSVWSHYMRNGVSALLASAHSPGSSPPEGCQLSHFSPMSWQHCTWNPGLATFKGLFVIVVLYKKKMCIYCIFKSICFVPIVVVLLLFLYRSWITQGQICPEANHKNTSVLFLCYYTFGAYEILMPLSYFSVYKSFFLNINYGCSSSSPSFAWSSKTNELIWAGLWPFLPQEVHFPGNQTPPWL